MSPVICGPCVIKGFTGQIHVNLARLTELLLLCLVDPLKARSPTAFR